MEKYFYVNTNGRQCGPVEEDKLISCGVTSSTKIWKRGMQGYVNAGKLLPHIFISETTKPNCDVNPTHPDNPKQSVKFYYIDKAGHQIGPVKEEDLVARGVVASTKIWRKGLPKYIEAGKILPALFQSEEYNSQSITSFGSKSDNIKGSATSQTNISDVSKNDDASVSTSSQTKITTGSKTKRDVVESTSEWKTFAIIQLIATFVVFLPLAIYFEFRVNELLYDHSSALLEYAHKSGRTGAMIGLAYIGAKIWPLVTIGIAGIVSLISIFKKNEGEQKKYTLYSLGICIGTVILGILSQFFPLVIFFMILAALVLGTLYSVFKN